MRYWVLLCALLAAGTSSANAAGQVWYSSYGKALRAAVAQQKPLLIVIGNSADGGRTMPVSLQSNENESRLLAKYVLCRVDVKNRYGWEVAKGFGPKSYPFTAIIAKSGQRVLYRKNGAFSASGWRATLAYYQRGTKPQPQRQAVAQTTAQPAAQYAASSSAYNYQTSAYGYSQASPSYSYSSYGAASSPTFGASYNPSYTPSHSPSYGASYGGYSAPSFSPSYAPSFGGGGGGVCRT